MKEGRTEACEMRRSQASAVGGHRDWGGEDRADVTHAGRVPSLLPSYPNGLGLVLMSLESTNPQRAFSSSILRASKLVVHICTHHGRQRLSHGWEILHLQKDRKKITYYGMFT